MIRDLFSNNIKKILSEDKWLIHQEKYVPMENLKYESLFCLTNGYMGTRGAYEENSVNSIPCTYVNGVFDKSETFMRELANMPNYLGLKLYVEKELLGVDTCEILEFSRVLDMKKSILVKRLKLKDSQGRETLIEGLRFLSRANVHRVGIIINVTPLNYSGIIEMENIVDGSVINFCDAPRFKVKHSYLVENSSLDESGSYIEVATRDRNLHVGVGSVIRAYNENKENIINNKHFNEFGETAIEFNDFNAKVGETVQIVKYISVYTQREVDKANIKSEVKRELLDFTSEGIDSELSRHYKVYDELWNRANIEIQGDFELDRAIRFNIYQLMSTASENDDTVNIGAKLLHGEEYGGHAFWDTEIFSIPFFSYVFPKTANNLVSYRYNLLNAARKNALNNGYKGAKYPWESADDGTEQCPDWTIESDGSCYRCNVAMYEHHVTAAVAFGIYNYYKITGDKEFLLEKGGEILLETARFWASRCKYNEAEDRYEINNVTGPDEWHEPVNNNIYTNYLAKWNIEVGLSIIEMLKKEHCNVYEDITAKICLQSKELNDWKAIKDKIYLPHKAGSKLLEQFEGYFNLKEVIIDTYDENDWPIRPAILKTIKSSETQIIKQADVVMLMYLLGEEFDFETKKINYEYYEKRTMHGSSLSPSIYSIMGLTVGDTSKAYRYLKRAAFIDLLDLQKNTREGIHAANAGGVWKTVVFGFAGMHIDKDGTLCFNPKLPKEWESLSFKVTVQGTLLKIYIDKNNQVDVSVLSGKEIKVKIENN